MWVNVSAIIRIRQTTGCTMGKGIDISRHSAIINRIKVNVTIQQYVSGHTEFDINILKENHIATVFIKTTIQIINMRLSVTTFTWTQYSGFCPNFEKR